MSKEKEYKKGDFQKIGTFINKKYYNQGWNEALQEQSEKVELLKKKIRELPNRDDWIQKDLPIVKGVLDGGGISKFETLDLIDKCFQIQEQGNAKGREDKELVSSEIVRANSKDLTFSQDSPAQNTCNCECGCKKEVTEQGEQCINCWNEHC